MSDRPSRLRWASSWAPRLGVALAAAGGCIALVLAVASGGERSSATPLPFNPLLGLPLVVWALAGVAFRMRRSDRIAAGADHAVPWWRASDHWRAASFTIDRRAYDPEGTAWTEMIDIARQHGYALVSQADPSADWQFARPSALLAPTPQSPREIRWRRVMKPDKPIEVVFQKHKAGPTGRAFEPGFPRSLAERESQILGFLLSSSDPRLDPLREQATRVSVADRWDCFPSIDLQVDGMPRHAVGRHGSVYGRVLIRASPREPDPGADALFLWVAEETLSAIELVRFGEAPSVFPEPSALEPPYVALAGPVM
jgi:hypothetical protein